MAKQKSGFSLSMTDQQCAGVSGASLYKALEIFAKFALRGTLDKMDGLSHVPRIPIEDCSLIIDSPSKSVMLSIMIPPEHEQELAAAVAAVYQDLRNQINRFGINVMIDAGIKAYG